MTRYRIHEHARSGLAGAAIVALRLAKKEAPNSAYTIYHVKEAALYARDAVCFPPAQRTYTEDYRMRTRARDRRARKLDPAKLHKREATREWRTRQALQLGGRREDQAS